MNKSVPNSTQELGVTVVFDEVMHIDDSLAFIVRSVIIKRNTLEAIVELVRGERVGSVEGWRDTTSDLLAGFRNNKSINGFLVTSGEAVPLRLDGSASATIARFDARFVGDMGDGHPSALLFEWEQKGMRGQLLLPEDRVAEARRMSRRLYE